MAQAVKQILIVDDSEIDRAILKSILGDRFNVIETDNGYKALEIISKLKNDLDIIFLDISMPLISGFDLLRLLRDNKLNHIPVFLISGEATKDNVLRASEFEVTEFIGKPFDREDILRRLQSRLGLTTTYELSPEDIAETEKYIAALENVYKSYLSNFGKDDSHYVHMSALMKILLTRYRMKNPEAELTTKKIDIISKAAYFCDIGKMMVPDKMSMISSRDADKVQILMNNHTKMGANIIRLNPSKRCEFFVQICTDMCVYHHERFDGKGYPYRLSGRNNLIYNQMCRLVDEFDTLLSKFYASNEQQASFVANRLLQDQGIVSPELLELLDECKASIFEYYARLV